MTADEQTVMDLVNHFITNHYLHLHQYSLLHRRIHLVNVSPAFIDKLKTDVLAITQKFEWIEKPVSRHRIDVLILNINM